MHQHQLSSHLVTAAFFTFVVLHYFPMFGGGDIGRSINDQGPIHTPSTLHAQEADTESPAEVIADEDPEERLQTAVEYWYAGESGVAIEIFRSLLEGPPDTDDGSVRESVRQAARDSLLMILRERGEYTEAIEVLEQYADDSSDTSEEGTNVDVQVTGGGDPRTVALLYLDGRTEEAGEAFERLEADAGPRTTLFAAHAFAAEGDSEQAITLADETLATEPYNPTAWQLKGQMYHTLGMEQQAISAFEQARRQEPNLTATLVPQAQAHLAREETAEARALLVRARAARPHDRRAERLLEELEEEAPELAEEEERQRERRRETAETPVVASHPDGLEDIPSIRVGLADSLTELHLKSGRSWEVFALDGTQADATAGSEPLLSGESDSIVTIAYEDGSIVVSVDDSRELSHNLSDGWLQLRTGSPDETVVLFDLEHSGGQFSAGSEDRAYRGSLRFGPSREEGFAVVNEVDVESYLYSVVPSEMPAYWPPEALRAQAIAARSYTLAYRGRFEERGYDLSGSVRSAFYRGYSGEDERTTDAVNATRGQVLERDGSPLAAYYSANNAGHTDSPEEVWGSGTTVGSERTDPEGVADPQLEWDGELRTPDEFADWLLDYPETYSSVAPFASRSAYRWEQRVEAEEIRERLGGDIGEVISLRILDRTPAGRVRAAKITGTDGGRELTGDSVRRMLGSLRSNLFFVNPVYEQIEDDSEQASSSRGTGPRSVDAFLFRGAGWGHGVGMDQTGAAGFASTGASAEEILEHYYPQAALEQRY